MKARIVILSMLVMLMASMGLASDIEVFGFSKADNINETNETNETGVLKETATPIEYNFSTTASYLYTINGDSYLLLQTPLVEFNDKFGVGFGGATKVKSETSEESSVAGFTVYYLIKYMEFSVFVSPGNSEFNAGLAIGCRWSTKKD